MPCYEVRTLTVEFRAENRTLLDAAIKAIGSYAGEQFGDRLYIDGGDIVLDLAAGMAEVRTGYQGRLNELKQAYSREAVKAAAKRVNWACKMAGNQATVTKMKW